MLEVSLARLYTIFSLIRIAGLKGLFLVELFTGSAGISKRLEGMFLAASFLIIKRYTAILIWLKKVFLAWPFIIPLMIILE